MNQGTYRQSIVKRALKTNYVPIDDRAILDRMFYTLNLSKKLNFFGLDNTVMADWETFFLKDASFIIVKIIKTDIHFFKKEHSRILNEPWATFYTAMAVENIISMVHTIVHWSDILVKTKYQGSLSMEIDQLVDAIATEIPIMEQWMVTLEESSLDDHIKTRVRTRFKKLTGHFNNEYGTDKENTYEMPFFNRKKEETHEILNLTFDRIYEKIIFLKESASRKIEEEIYNRTDHPPHVGLLLAFFELSEFVQEDINQLSKKHLDYYYQEILRQPKPGQMPHTALVCIVPPKETYNENIPVPKDTILEFILKNGEVHPFGTTSKLHVNGAIIADILTLHKSEYSPFNLQSHNDDFIFNRLYDSKLLVDGSNYINIEAENAEYLPCVLGEDYSSEMFPGAINHSEIGFMISSPALLMEKGDQRVVLELNFERDSFEKVEDLFNDLANQELLEAKEDAIHEGLTKKRTISHFFRDAFDIYISDQSGWRSLLHFKVQQNRENHSIKILFNLKENGANLVPFQKEIHTGDFETNWPCIRILLNNDALHHPYSILKHLIIKDIQIQAQVQEVRNVNVSSSLGTLDNSIPFAPFGPAPKIGSYLRISNPLILQKNLIKLRLNLEWGGLPQGPDGFLEYYKAYGRKVDNTSFRAQINQTNRLDAKLQEIELFRSKSLTNSNQLDSSRTIDVQLEKLGFNHPLAPSIQKTDDSALYLILNCPDIAFGHHIFSNIYSEAALLKSKFRKKTLALPNQPYTPLLEKLTVNYTNYAKEIMSRKQDDDGSDIQFTHFHPYGFVQVFPGPIKSPCFLLPQIKYHGNLFIGLKNIKARDVVNIGFDLVPAVYSSTIIKAPDIIWEYLHNNEWISGSGLLVEDTTNGLIKSGIVKIAIPKHPQFNNSLLPKGKFWIRAASIGKENPRSKIKSVFTNAVELASKSGSPITPELGDMDNNIKKINVLDTLEGKINIIGPFDLKIHSNPFTESVLNCHISERLRHKNRAVSTWDFEHLILEHFPIIEKVRVYGRNGYPQTLVKGSSIQIVLIPKINTTDPNLKNIDKVPYHLLCEVQNFVEQFVSPFVNVEVSNPIYELLKVKCTIKLVNTHKKGELTNQLNMDLVRFLSPAIPYGTHTKGFESRISKTQILNFIEKKSYVEYVTGFSVLQLIEVSGKYKIIDTATKPIEFLRTISPYAILTSAPEHNIEVIDIPRSDAPRLSGIEDLSIASDFIISDIHGKYN